MMPKLAEFTGCAVQSDHMRFFSKPGVFTPHESHRTVVLASVPLASFHRRGADLAIDFLLFALLWITLKISIPYFVEHRLHIGDEAHPLKVWHGHVSVKTSLSRHWSWSGPSVY